MADMGDKEGKTKIQKLEYLKNEKRFLDEIKNIFHSFWMAIIWLKIEIWSKIVDKTFKQVHMYHYNHINLTLTLKL